MVNVVHFNKRGLRETNPPPVHLRLLKLHAITVSFPD